MTLMIIGGSGFIGTRLANRLKLAKKDFLIFDKIESKNHKDELCKGDVRDLNILNESIKHGSILINLAAEHRDDVRPVSLYQDVNVGGAKNICEVAESKQVHTIIFTSSVAVYGFAPLGTDETGAIAPFNEYGRTKYEAELIFRKWQAKAPVERKLVIIRPTVVFGEQNRGNVYNLLRQIASGRFVMVGHGENRKSLAYVENVAAFIEHSLSFDAGVHIYNFIDKPDFSMNELVKNVDGILSRHRKIQFRLPYVVGYFIGKCFDALAVITGKRFPISSIRIKKFCSNSVYNTAIETTGFVAPVPLEKALEKTVRYEFLESHVNEGVFYTE